MGRPPRGIPPFPSAMLSVLVAVMMLPWQGASAAEVKGTLITAPSGNVASKGTGTSCMLTAYEEEIARLLRFERQVLMIVKEEAHDRIGRLIGFDDAGYQIHAPGVVVSVSEERTEQVLTALRFRLRPLGYLPFVAEINGSLKIDKIGILKSADQYEILRIMSTNGAEFDITNQDIIDRLKEWEYLCAFDIVGADSDWVEIEFRVLPQNLRTFAEEVYDFSPDTVDQGPGTVDGLVRDIMRTSRLFLWWD